MDQRSERGWLLGCDIYAAHRGLVPWTFYVEVGLGPSMLDMWALCCDNDGFKSVLGKRCVQKPRWPRLLADDG